MADTDIKLDLVDSSQSAAEDGELNSWLWRLKNQINRAFRQAKLWINDHVFLESPFFQDPHPQYWHKILDPAWTHMYFENFTTPKTVLLGDPITGWTGHVLTDWQLDSDLITGQVTIDSTEIQTDLGAYQMSVTGFVDVGSNVDAVFTLYANGSPTIVRMPAITKGTLTSASIGWSGVVDIASEGILDIRLEDGTASADIYTLNWSLHRISPAAGTAGVIVAPDVNEDHPPPAPIPDNWGGPPP